MTILISLLIVLAIFLIVYRQRRMRPVAPQLVRETLASYDIPANLIDEIAQPVQTIADFERMKDDLEREHFARSLSKFSITIARSCPGTHQSSFQVAIAVFQLALNGKMVHPALTKLAVNNAVNEKLLLGLIKQNVENTSTFDRGHRFLFEPSGYSVTCWNEKLFVDWKTCEYSNLGENEVPGDFLAAAALSFINPSSKLKKIAGIMIADQPRGWSQVAENVRTSIAGERKSQ